MIRFFKLQLFLALVATFALEAKTYTNSNNSNNSNNASKTADMRPNAVLSDSVTPSFNTSARVRTTGSDFFAEGTFIWWHLSQEYMDVARSASFVQNAASSPAPFARVAVHLSLIHI